MGPSCSYFWKFFQSFCRLARFENHTHMGSGVTGAPSHSPEAPRFFSSNLRLGAIGSDALRFPPAETFLLPWPLSPCIPYLPGEACDLTHPTISSAPIPPPLSVIIVMMSWKGSCLKWTVGSISQHLISDIITMYSAMANETGNKIYHPKRYKRAFKISARDYILLNSNFKLSIEFMWFFSLFQVMTALARHGYFDSY